MRIKRATLLVFERQLDGRAFNPVFRWRERRAPLIVIETDAGARGIGEAWSRYTDIESVLAALALTTKRIEGCDIPHPLGAASDLLGAPAVAAAPWAMAAALSAVDIALWDAFGHEQGQPVWRLLGGATDQAPVYASGGLYRDGYSNAELAAEMRSYLARGFRAVKMKIAGLGLDEDMARVRAVRDAVGAGTTIWVDAVNRLDVHDAMRWSAELAKLGVAAIQSPIPAEDVAGLAALNRQAMPVIASESEFVHEAFQELLDRQAVTHLQFCLALCGGFSGARALDARARAAGVSTTPQCFSTSVAQAATLHFAAAHSNVVSAEYHGYHDHLKALYRGSTGQVGAGMASAGALPGLGVAIPRCGPQRDGSVIGPYLPA
jgi:L-alanine-DL-glutamate epimerase-like enolase superfamily enzyme